MSGERIWLYKRILLRLVILAALIVFVHYAVPMLFSLLSPFILALIMAAVLNPLVSVLQKRLRAPRRFLSLVLVILFFLGISTCIVWFISTLARETILLARNIQDLSDYFISSVDTLTKRLKWLLDFFPVDTEETLTGIMDTFYLWFQTASKEAADYVLSNTATITGKVSSGVFATVMFILASYFITADYSKISVYLSRFRGSDIYTNFIMLKNAVKSAIGGYIRAQLLLALSAFIIMFVALVIYRQEYALLIALLLAIVDFLPFVGTSVVLVPWSIFSAIGGDIGKAVFLLVLAGAFFLFRRFAEPKIMSTQTGLLPLLSLISIYIGMKFMGVWGMILGPIITMIIISVIKAGFLENTIKDIKTVYYDISGMLKSE